MTRERYSLGEIATIGKNRNQQDMKGSPATIGGRKRPDRDHWRHRTRPPKGQQGQRGRREIQSMTSKFKTCRPVNGQPSPIPSGLARENEPQSAQWSHHPLPTPGLLSLRSRLSAGRPYPSPDASPSSSLFDLLGGLLALSGGLLLLLGRSARLGGGLGLGRGPQSLPAVSMIQNHECHHSNLPGCL